MDTSTLKKFAPAARNQLLAAVGLKLDYVLSARTPDYLGTYAPQVAALRRLAAADRTGLVERVAYTWFNRLAALRFIDARGWHPFHARVLTPAMGDTQPELLKVVRSSALPEELRRHTNPARLADLLDGRVPSTDAQGEVYRHLVLAACRYYNALLPDIFARLDDETELLLPDDMLTEHSVVHGFRTEISDEDCGDGQRANVEMLGWLYQFYISERKDQVMARKSAVPTEDIPAVTQLFTPHWIVRYLVENSLGRLWLLNRPGSRLREHMPYYIESGTDSSSEASAKEDFLRITKPEEIRLCDPAVGSGHMLTYAFDLLTLIYEEEGYAPTEIPALILRHNLHGLEICPRAAQLAELALVFKAREKSRRFFQPEHLVRPRIIELRDVRFAENELRDYIHALGLGDLFNQPMLRLLHQFEEAKNFGSLIQPCLDERAIALARRAIEAKDLGGQLFLRETHLKVLRVLAQAEALTQRYHVVVANPPYMGGKQMNGRLKEFLEINGKEGKADLYAAFIQRNLSLAKASALVGMITIPNWMFIEAFEELRDLLIDKFGVQSLIHNGRGIWGPDFGSCAFVLTNSPERTAGVYVKLYDRQGEVNTNETLRNRFLQRHERPIHRVPIQEFTKLPGSSFLYWFNERYRELFQLSGKIEDYCGFKRGTSTGDNPQFLRFWHEVSLGRSSNSTNPAAKWFLYNKGGANRKWYGNLEHVVEWENNGQHLRSFKGAYLRNIHHAFKPCVSYGSLTIGTPSFRFYTNCLSDQAGNFLPTANRNDAIKILALLNSKPGLQIANWLSPTVNILIEDLNRIPLPDGDWKIEAARGCLEIAETDWNNFETSWDFRDQPLLRPGLKGATLEASWRNWEAESSAAIRRMQELETENNRLFIAAYGLDGELQPEVPEAQITLARAEARRDMAAFLSYAVGCMMGRYSPDHPGLILANAGDTLREFLEKVGKPLGELTFAPDEDGIIPVLDGEWFEDDIVARTRDFLRATFGEATLRENLRFLEDSLGKDLRKYFLNDFYKDHLQTYKKRPIYWMIQSPKKGFSVIVYLHRYTRDSLNLVLNRYLREYQAKLGSRIAALAQAQVSATSAAAKTEARKESDKLTKVLLECQEWERQALLPLAQQRVELDLDDGVKVNYPKLGEVLAPIPGLAAAEE